MSVLTSVYVSLFSVVTVLALAVTARRLLGTSFSVPRTAAAGVLAFLVGGPIIRAIGGSVPKNGPIGPAIWLAVLGVALTVLSAMVALVLAEAFFPSGSLPTVVEAVRGLRRWVARTRRYMRIMTILIRHGLRPYLRGRQRPESDAKLARALTGALEDGGVTFVKFGQVLSTRRDLLSAAFTDELSRLQDRATPVPWPEIERILLEEVGDAFAEVDPEPLAAASIAQVHTARLTSGEEVVIKVQRPGVRRIVDVDLDIVRKLAITARDRTGWGRSMGTVELADGFAVALREELDFTIEARNMTGVAAAAEQRDDRSVTLPKAYEALCTARVLVMERLDGAPLGTVLDAPGLDRETLARTLFETLLRQVMLDGVFHADPHPGNIMLLPDGSLGMLDFGSVGRLDSALRDALQRLLMAVDRGDAAELAASLLEVVERPEEIDEHALERVLGAFLARHMSPGAVPDVRMFTDLFRIVSRHGLAVPPEIAGAFRALATLEGSLTRLAPGFDIVAEARRFAHRHLMERMRPESLRQAATDELTSLLPMLRRLPRRLDRLTGALEEGRFNVNVRLLADRRDRRTVSALLNQVLLTVLAATAGIMAVLLIGLRGGPAMTRTVGVYQFMGYCLLVICAVLALRVLVVIFRPERASSRSR